MSKIEEEEKKEIIVRHSVYINSNLYLLFPHLIISRCSLSFLRTLSPSKNCRRIRAGDH